MSAPENLSIDTPEQITLEFPLANVGSRFLAVALDYVLQGAAGLVLFLVFVAIEWFAAWWPRWAVPWVLAVVVAAGFVVTTTYFALFESLWGGQTPGKRTVGIRVIDASGRPMSVHAAITRNLVRIIDQVPGLYAIGILSVLVTERQQRLGDLAAGTVVVHDRMERLILQEPAAVVSKYGGQRLDPTDIVVIEGFLGRRRDLDAIVRMDAARRIAARMAAKLQIASVEDDERLLEQLAREYRSS